MYSDLYILLIKLVIVSIPFSPILCNSCRNVVITAGLSFWQILDHSYNFFTADCVYLIHQITHISFSSVFILIQFLNILRPSFSIYRLLNDIAFVSHVSASYTFLPLSRFCIFFFLPSYSISPSSSNSVSLVVVLFRKF